MASKVGIWNDALRELGAFRVTSPDDGSPEAIILGDIWEQALDELLESHHWNFATFRRSLVRLESPGFQVGWEYAFSRPPGLIRVLHVTNNSGDPRSVIEYAIEGSGDYETSGGAVQTGAIYANYHEVWMTWIGRVEDPNLMSPLFRRALSLKLAEHCAVPLTNSQSVKDQVSQRFLVALRAAKSSDSIQDGPTRLPESPWVTRR